MRPYKSNEASYIRRELAYLVGVLAVIGAAALLGYWMMEAL